MKCLKCNYIFSEEKKVCPKCGADMGMVFEKLGYFPPSTSKPFLTVEDFQEKSLFGLENKEEIVLEEE
ncbi:MAG: hypothetical protein H0Z16_00210 [Thermodesulfobacterium sp.]|nr:hypothetical protein [Thermodesulfobacterium sp.]HEA84163.1 hypothetical protein [Thermodesulfobacterium geofontis]